MGSGEARDPIAAARARIAAWEPWLGALVTELDPAIGAGGPGPLQDMVLGMKDLFAVAGVPRRCGAPELTDPAPQPAHATAVRRLVEAGGRIVVTLALHQFAFGIISPQTRNPRAPARVAGGSSGGSAAALAAGWVDGSLGTDTGGSIRIPAACCGVVGLKTTRGLVPLTGVQPLAPSLDTVGPMARSVADVARLLDVVAGEDPTDPYSEAGGVPAHSEAGGVTAHRVQAAAAGGPPGRDRLRVGVPAHTRAARMDDDVRRVWDGVLVDLAASGATVVDVDLPALEGAHTANGVVLAAEAAWVHAERLAAQPGAFWPSVRTRLERGRDLPATRLAEAHHHSARLRADLRRVFAGTDVLLTPTLPCRAPPVDTDPIEVGGEPEPVVVAMTRFTNPWNLTGVPAGSVPAGTDRNGAPVGVQVVAPWFAEPTVLAVMAAIEELRGGPWPPEPAPAR